ncbi:MAG: aminotransferase class V-fold PLP-dependent enzyme [Spirochaetales bacterium]|nr:aminotransferase class V-fold PLP-dependent enzyme [Spirochaetales bacterium]
MNVDWDEIRADVVGFDATIVTPYGDRRIAYADFTASGRALRSFERYVEYLLEHYANTHTEDDTTGRLTSRRLSAAERIIKDRLNADEHYKLVAVGAGATAAINRLQQMLGVYIPPATRDRLECTGRFDVADPAVRSHLPVVFVGPYEHHSNEISWREGLAEVVEVELDGMGRLSLDDLEAKLADPAWNERQKIGSFSAASNVSGVRTDVYAVARILHRHDALAFFDYSASAPYARIDVRHDREAYFDGVFFSPHKYVGGPGASGILLVRNTLYRDDLPPSVSGGGTVSFVNATTQDYLEDIEEREKAGTPGIIQTVRAALAIDLQHLIGIEAIEERERELIGRALDRLGAVSGIEIVGDAPPAERLAIFSFNVRAGTGYLHPRFVVRLLNDLFGIQSRAGCSCAGPYGHRLLHIDPETSERYRAYIRRGEHGVKPGWVRLNFHYLATDEEFDFICSAVEFIARHGRLFLADYRFDLKSGAWVHRDEVEEDERIGAEAALAVGRGGGAPDSPARRPRPGDADAVRVDRARYFDEAIRRAGELAGRFPDEDLKETADELIPFWYLSSVR